MYDHENSLIAMTNWDDPAINTLDLFLKQTLQKYDLPCFGIPKPANVHHFPLQT